MAVTLGQITDNVALMLLRTDLNTQIQTEAKQAINYYASERFWFTESRISFTCSSGVSEYTLSASVLEVIAVQITRNSSSYVINPLAEKDRLSYDTSNITGDPSWYSMFGGRFIPYPSPSATYTVGISAVVKPATLSVTGNSNVWTNNAQELIESRTAANVCMRFIRDDTLANNFKLLESEALENLRRKESRREPSRIIPTKF